MLHLGLSLRLGARVSVQGSVTPPAVALDAPVTSALASTTQLAFGFDRLVAGYSGSSVRLQRGGVQQDFGFNASSGAFDAAAVITWAAGATVTVVKFYDQKGGAKTLDANTATSIQFCVGGGITRFAADWSTTDGQLTLKTDEGGVGCRVTGGGYFTLASSGIVFGSGLEFHFLAAPLARKKANATTDAAALAATNTSEAVFSYGTGGTNYFRYIYGGGTSSSLLRRIGTGAGGTDQTLTGLPILKKNGQTIFSARCDGTEISLYGLGRKPITAATSAGNVTANASLDNGQLRVGEGYATGVAGNMLFGGIIVTGVLANADRQFIHCALNAIAQQHDAITTTDLMALFSELFDFRYPDSNGLVTGMKGQAALQFNKTTGAPNFDFAYVTPQGWQGVRSPSNTNADNTYRVPTNFFTDISAGSVLSVCVNENADINQTWSLRSDSDSSDFSVGLGRHHTTPNLQRCAAASRDTQGWTRHLYTDDGSDGGLGKISQAMGKYHFNLASEWTPGNTTTAEIVSVLYGVTIPIGTVLTTEVAATVGVVPITPEEAQFSTEVDIKFLSTPGEMLYHIATFQPGPSYNKADPEATRRLYMRTATNRCYLAHPASPVGHRDASVYVENGTGSVVDSDASHHIQSNSYQGETNKGTHLFWGFCDRPWTMKEARQIQVNLYKLQYSGYPS